MTLRIESATMAKGKAATAEAAGLTIHDLVGMLEKESTRRDELREIEVQVQAFWDKKKPFEVDAPQVTTEEEEEALYHQSGEERAQHKFFTTFPYPYMNGLLHLGHAFSFSKNEFSSAYFRMKGRKSLFPFSFHCTGMPIKAAAGRIQDELDQFGALPPPQADDAEHVQVETTEAQKEGDSDAAAADSPSAGGNPTVFRAKKGKLVGKKDGKRKLQYEVLSQMGVADKDLASFADPLKWLSYFPPLGLRDLKDFGMRCDFRRSFITTDANPFYDAFVSWQFRLLQEQGLIAFARSRPDVYSPKDGQSCADHDRSSGEGVRPTEYTLIKMSVLQNQPKLEEEDGVDFNRELPTVFQEAFARGAHVSLLCATLRPETMYGQTNCWILPDAEYLVIQGVEKDQVYVLGEHAARNASYQNLTTERGSYQVLGHVKGTDVIGLAVAAPLARYEYVYVLPMKTISMKKGTGIVTSVPSDAPDDYAAFGDLKKAKNRAEYNVALAMVEPFVPQHIVDVMGYEGTCMAPVLCDKAKISSQKDRTKLDEVKAVCYRLGFYKAVMAVPEDEEVNGKPVSIVKTVIRARLIRDGLSLPFYEPESEVVSRSGDVCVVALTDQYFIRYGDADWKAQGGDAWSPHELVCS